MGPAVTASVSHRRATVLFVRMWAIAHVLHLLIADRNALHTPWSIAVVALAFAVLLRPESGRLVAAMCAAQIVEYVAVMPFGPDHWALVSLVNAAILLTMLVGRSTGTDTLARALPAARVILLVGYGAAALSKWNTTFLDPVTSCANAIASAVSFGLAEPLRDSPLLSWGATLTETSVFLLLLVPRTRRWGVVLGLAFHFSLSASPVMAVSDFTSTVYALFLLFLHPDTTAQVLDRTSRWASRSAIVRDAGRRPWFTAVVSFVVLGFGGYVFPAGAYAPLYVLAQAYFVTIMAATLLSVRADVGGARVGRLLVVHLPVLALALVWALNPYLGLRTTGSFTMFSNLRTESPQPNHLFMPSWRLTDWQDDMVVLRSSNDDELQLGATNDLALPLVSLRRIATDHPSLVVTGVLHGNVVTWGPHEGQRALEPLPWWTYKFALLRPVSVTDRPFCSQS